MGLHLIEEFWNVTPRPNISVMDVRPLPPVSPNFYSFDPTKINVYTGDITSEVDVIKVIKQTKPDVIVHSASPIHGMGEKVYRKVNVVGTINLVNCAKKLKIKAFVYTSSAGVLFNGGELHNADESWPYACPHMDAYNETKATAEEYVLNNSSDTFRTAAIRPAGIFGPGDRQLIPGLRDVGRQNKHKFALGDNLNLFDVTYVGNVAYAHVLAAQKLLDPKTVESVNGEAFLVTNDSPIYFWSLGREIWKYDGKIAEKTISIPYKIALALGYLSQIACYFIGKEPTLTPFRVRTTCATRYFNISKAKNLLGYEPKVGLEEAIKLSLKSMDETIG